MAKKRGNDWEGLIRAVGALVILLVGMVVLQSHSGGKSLGTTGAGALGALLSVVASVVAIAVVLAIAVGIIFLLWKAVNVRPPWDRFAPHRVPTQLTDPHQAERARSSGDVRTIQDAVKS